MSVTRKKKFIEQSYQQWMLIRALAFAERDWFLASIVIFWAKESFVFISFAGLMAFFVGVLFIAPVIGICLHTTQMIFYRRSMRAHGDRMNIAHFKKTTWKANIIWLPIVCMLCYGVTDLFFDMRDDMVKALDFKSKN